MCQAALKSAKANNVQRAGLPGTDAEIDPFLADTLDAVSAKLAAGRTQVTGGEATPLEPLNMLLRDAGAGR